jgi:molecular chaperone Hsp33
MSEPAPVEIRSYFIRGRNCLLTRGRFSDLYVDYYLHLMEYGIRHDEPVDLMLKEALAGMALHLASRPQDEGCAWTIHYNNPLMNLFVAGSTRPAQVTGRLFSEDVRDMGKSLFISQTTRQQSAVRQSMIDIQGTDVLSAIEQFYTQSEQRLTRLFRLDEEDFVQISAEPDADEAWLTGLMPDEIPRLDQSEQLSLLETRFYVFNCGCSLQRLYPMLMRLTDDDLDYVFEDGHAKVTCPRCGAQFRATKQDFLSWRTKHEAA